MQQCFQSSVSGCATTARAQQNSSSSDTCHQLCYPSSNPPVLATTLAWRCYSGCPHAKSKQCHAGHSMSCSLGGFDNTANLEIILSNVSSSAKDAHMQHTNAPSTPCVNEALSSAQQVAGLVLMLNSSTNLYKGSTLMNGLLAPRLGRHVLSSCPSNYCYFKGSRSLSMCVVNKALDAIVWQEWCFQRPDLPFCMCRPAWRSSLASMWLNCVSTLKDALTRS